LQVDENGGVRPRALAVRGVHHDLVRVVLQYAQCT
jgi:hypothetical protein